MLPTTITPVTPFTCNQCQKITSVEYKSNEIGNLQLRFCRADCYHLWHENHQVTAQKSCASPSTTQLKTEQVGKSLETAPPPFDFDGMDTSIKPGDDFYHYTSGNWIKQNTIPKGYSRWGTIMVLKKEVNDRILHILQNLENPQIHEGKLAKAAFQSAMDMETRNTAAINPLREFIKKIETIHNKEEMIPIASQLHEMDVKPFFSWEVNPNPLNNQTNILHLFDGGINLPDFEIYLPEKDNASNQNQTKREKYQEFIRDTLVQAGMSIEEAAKAAKDIFDFETELAKVYLSKEKREDPDITVNVLSFSELEEKAPNMIWASFFKTLNVVPDVVNSRNPRFLERMSELLNNESLDTLKAYLKFCLLKSFATSIDDTFFNMHFNFYDKFLKGIKEPLPMEEWFSQDVSRILGDAVGNLYVEKYFSPTRKQKVIQMLEEIKEAMVERIQKLSWMKELTKQKVIEKVHKMVVLIGYPEKGYWNDYSKLKTIDGKRSYLANVMDIRTFNVRNELSKINKPLDKHRWPYAWHPQIMNNRNCRKENTILFPAGVLEHPLFTSDDPITWGAFGMIIAHEILHSFDDIGRKYDAQGNKCDWWPPEDIAAFEAHAKVIEKQFNGYSLTFKDGTTQHVNGKMTLPENIADLGGLVMSFAAFKKANAKNSFATIDGWTPEQRFFLGYSQVWRNLAEDDYAKQLLSNDPHSPPKWRVNGPLSQLTEFKEAFNLPDQCPMVIPPEQRSEMWSINTVSV